METVAYVPAIRRLKMVLSAVRVVDESMPIQELAAFLEVAERSGTISIMELSNLLGISESSASRNISALGEWHYKKKPGLCLVETRVDPMEMRRKHIHLTAKGKRLIEQISAILTSSEGGSKK